MNNTERTTVYVCFECGEQKEPTAPRSCVTCRVSMCEHLWEAGAGLARVYNACVPHDLCKRFGIQLPIDQL